MTFAARLKGKSAKGVHQATLKTLRPIRDLLKTMTNDNGREFASHERTAKRLKVKVYFCHPYSSYERGTNENTNGLLRQYFPKSKTDFTKVSNRVVRSSFEQIEQSP